MNQYHEQELSSQIKEQLIFFKSHKEKVSLAKRLKMEMAIVSTSVIVMASACLLAVYLVKPVVTIEPTGLVGTKISFPAMPLKIDRYIENF